MNIQDKSVKALVVAMQERGNGWLKVYAAASACTLGEAALSEVLMSEESEWSRLNLGKASGQTIGNWRRAHLVAAANPHAAAAVGKDGEIHKAIGYAISKGMNTRAINAWTKRTIDAMADAPDTIASLRDSLKELRDLAKDQAAKPTQ